MRLPDPTGLWCVRVLASTGLFKWDSASEGTPTSLRPLGGTRDLCFLAEQVYWHSILPDLPGRSAWRPDPTRPWFVRVLNSTSLLCSNGNSVLLSVLKTIQAVRAFKQTIRTAFLICCRAKGRGYFFAGWTQRRPVLPKPRPAPMPRRAPPGSDQAVVCPCFFRT